MDKAIIHCRMRKVAVQAGGNIGAWPRYLADKFENVLTFEPERINYACLAKNTEGFTNIEHYKAALSDTNGSFKLHVADSIGSHHMTNEPGETKTFRLDAFELEYCDLIVLDIEGAEMLALKGAEKIIEVFAPVIMLEDRSHGEKKGFGYSSADLHAHMDSLGYGIKTKVRHDVVWVPKDFY